MKEFDQINLDSELFEEENLQSEMDMALEGTVESQQDYTGIGCSGVGSASCQTGCKDGCKETGKNAPCQLMAYGKKNWHYPDPRCPKAPTPYYRFFYE